MRTLGQSWQALGLYPEYVDRIIGRGLQQPARVFATQLGQVRTTGTRSSLVQAGPHQHRVIHVDCHGGALAYAFLPLQVANESAEIRIRRSVIDLAQAQAVRREARVRRIQSGQSATGHHGPGAVGDHVDLPRLRMQRQHADQVGESRCGAGGVGHVLGKAQEAFSRWPDVGQHHRIAPGEMPVLRRLRRGPLHARVRAMHVDGQVLVITGCQGLVDQAEERQAVCTATGVAEQRADLCLLVQTGEQDFRAQVFAIGLGGKFVQRLPGDFATANAQIRYAQVQVVGRRP